MAKYDKLVAKGQMAGLQSREQKRMEALLRNQQGQQSGLNAMIEAQLGTMQSRLNPNQVTVPSQLGQVIQYTGTTTAHPILTNPGVPAASGAKKSASTVRRKSWEKIRFEDLRTGDRLIIAPEVTKAKSATPDNPNTPVWGGQFGKIVGVVEEIGSDTVLISFGSQTIVYSANKEHLADYGILLEAHFLNLTAPSPGKGKVSFETVILPEKSKQAILDTIKQVDNHGLIFEEWGFGETFEKGTAISMLFYGEPGTGKTLAAQAIADQFGYHMKTISTAEIETPEPGGAERNIKQAFEEAKEGKTVLLFDECDSLVSSRKHMGAIMAAQVNVLLTELERYTGIVVFTTNRIETLDEAFDRRLSLKLAFEMPSHELRTKIWARMFPQKAPLADDVDFGALASVEIAGGHIKNTVLKAARAAANQDLPNKDKKITQEILVEALTSEVKSTVAFTDAKKHESLYGTPLSPGMQRRIVERGRGKLGVKP